MNETITYKALPYKRIFLTSNVKLNPTNLRFKIVLLYKKYIFILWGFSVSSVKHY